MKVLCGHCEEEFEAKRSTARFCSARCRQRASRGSAAGSEKDSTAPKGDSDLVKAVRLELTKAKRLDTVAGQIAIQLAHQVTTVGSTGIAGLSKELRVVMAEALAGTPGSGPAVVEDQDDELARARRGRDDKARAAAGRA